MDNKTLNPVVTTMLLSTLLLVVLPAVGNAAPIVNCNSNFTVCGIPENTSLQLPFEAIAGDAVITESDHTTVSDVFRIFNNLLNTGSGTGLGNMVFLYSSDDSTPLPPSSTYSANRVFIVESPTGVTPYLGNGTTYLLGVPEPWTPGLLGSGIAAMAVLARRRLRTIKGELGCDGGYR
jgi:hypothetical protein